ncbi:MAG: ISAzo13 family transposase, partial [Candidatus Heimdallarchaeota archaeon]
LIIVDQINDLINDLIPNIDQFFKYFQDFQLIFSIFRYTESHLAPKHPEFVDTQFYSTFQTYCQYFLITCLNEKQRRLFAGLLALKYNYVSQVSAITGISRKTIGKGKKQLLDRLPINAIDQNIRISGGGRKSSINLFEPKILKFLEDETAGDPMSRVKWIRRSLRNINRYLQNQVSIATISKILKKNSFSLRYNLKSKAVHASHPDRNQQFEWIKSQKILFNSKEIPVLSIDGKKKELIGDFKQNGKAWRPKGRPHEIADHEFANQAIGNFLPYGIYDVYRNHGYVVAGTSKGTTEFAVDAIVIWWQNVGSNGSNIYLDCKELYLLLDAGRPNSYRGHLLKYLIQIKLADKFGLTVHVSHYPPGTSKYNPIERKLFSFISINWEGRPLDSYETALNYILSTKTQSGLSVDAVLHEKEYTSGLAFTIDEYATTNISYADICSKWNYSIRPRDELITLQKRKELEEKRITKDIWHFSNKSFESKRAGMKELDEFKEKSNWRYYTVNGFDILIKDKRKDGKKGRPFKGCEMIQEYFFNIQFSSKESRSNL